ERSSRRVISVAIVLVAPRRAPWFRRCSGRTERIGEIATAIFIADGGGAPTRVANPTGPAIGRSARAHAALKPLDVMLECKIDDMTVFVCHTCLFRGHCNISGILMIAHVTHAIAIAVCLVRVVRRRAIVNLVAYSVAILIDVTANSRIV